MVSVVLPTYNGAKYLRNSIESVLGQTLQDWELIIVNDCSTDNTDEIITEYMAVDSRIHVIKNDENRKLPTSLNIGFASARGKYLTWTSDDNMYLPEALEKMALFLDTHKENPMVVGRMTNIDDNGRFMRVFTDYDSSIMWINNVVGACFMYRRSVLDKIGGYDPAFVYAEDYEYWLRILEECGPIGRLPEILYVYRYHASSLTTKKRAGVSHALQMMRKAHLQRILQGINGNVTLMHFLYDSFVREGNMDNLRYVQQNMQTVLPGIEYEKFDFPKGEYIMLGIGEMGETILKAMGEQIKYLADINPSTTGQIWNGKLIISFADVLEKLAEGYLLLIAVSVPQMYEVIRQATKAGLKEYRTGINYLRIHPDA